MTQHNDFEMPASVNIWLEGLNRAGKSRATLQAYRRALHHFVRWLATQTEGDFDPQAVLGRDVRAWQSHQQRLEGAAPSTVNQRLVAVSSYFKWALGQNLIRHNPCQDLKTLRLPPRQAKGLNPRDVRRLLRAVHKGGDLRDIALVELLLGTGLRVGEALALRLGDIQLSERGGLVTVREGKGRLYRRVPLNAEVRQALRPYLSEHPAASNPAAPLWTGRRGGLTHRSSVLRLLNRYAKTANLPPLNPHSLRHTFATRYLEQNRDDLRGLAALLGHRSLDTVMIYTEPSLEDLALRLENLME
jgi:site-specific recombinase XerD